MCRKNHLWGCCAICFGLGLLIGRGFESGLIALALGIGLTVLGLSFLRQK